MELNVLLTTFCNNYSRISLAIVLHNNFALNSNLPNVVNRISYLRLGSERCSMFQRYLFYAISPAAVEAEACIGFDRIITSHNREVWSQVLFERDPSRFFFFFFFTAIIAMHTFRAYALRNKRKWNFVRDRTWTFSLKYLATNSRVELLPYRNCNRLRAGT